MKNFNTINLFNDSQQQINKSRVYEIYYTLDSEYRLLIKDNLICVADTKENILLKLKTKQNDKYCYCFCDQLKYIAIYKYQLRNNCPNELKIFDLRMKKFIATIIDCARIEENVFMIEFSCNKVIIFYDQKFRHSLLSGHDYLTIFKFPGYCQYGRSNGILLNKSIVLQGLKDNNCLQQLVFYRFSNEKMLKSIFSKITPIQMLQVLKKIP